MRKYDISDNAFTINTKEKRKCKCGHTQLLGMQDRVICNYCGK